jgi:hypothetical protein
MGPLIHIRTLGPPPPPSPNPYPYFMYGILFDELYIQIKNQFNLLIITPEMCAESRALICNYLLVVSLNYLE